MKKMVILLMYFVLTGISFAGQLPTIPTPPSINTWNVGIIFNAANGSVKTITYGICEFTPGDTQHQTIVCPPPFYTENIEGGKYLSILIPKDILDAQGNLITHYTAAITQIKSKELSWLSGQGMSCGMDLSKNLNAILLNENETAITCKAGTFGFLAKSDANYSALEAISSQKKLNNG